MSKLGLFFFVLMFPINDLLARHSSYNDHPNTQQTARSCSAQDYRYGQWIPGAAQCGIKAKYDHPLTEKCTFRGSQKLTSPHHYADWCWKPFGCLNEPFSVKDFCRKLSGRGILIVGDSIQHQFYDALFMQLGTPGQPLGQWTLEPDIHKNTSGLICDGQGGGRLVYLRNDQIAVTDTTPLYARARKDVYRADWAAIAPMFGIIILNKGAHYIPNDALYKAETRTTANWLLKSIDFNRTQVFFRDTPQGHPNATQTTVAINDTLLVAPDWIKEEHYEWSTFPRRNREAIEVFESILGPFVTILYVAHMTFNRPDGHRHDVCSDSLDNLHYLLPSVVDSWIQPLFNLMTEAHQ